VGDGSTLRRSRGADSHQPVPSVNVVVANEAGEIRLIRRTDNGNWAVPGGAFEFREPPGSGDAV
jgi:ADP-ribose pyrophosphatase YjhB (NUDIX family)